MNSPFTSVLVPLLDTGDQSGRLPPASILASWFDARVQIICGDSDSFTDLQILAASLGAPTEPVVELDGLPVDGLTALAHSSAPSLLVTKATDAGLELAAASTQPVFLVADKFGRRMPVGPLAVEITGSETDLDAVALAAVVARALEESVRLVVSHEGDESPAALTEAANEAEQRLRQMGCEVGVDVLRSHGLHPLVLVGRTRETTAIVIPQARLKELDLIERATAQGVNVLVAPSSSQGAGRAAPFRTDLTRPRRAAPPGAALQVLDRAECLARLSQHALGRLGYIDAGWPTVVPVNYRVHEGDIFIRTLEGGKLRAAERRDTVCLELDGYEEQLRSGWSVVAHGVLEVITDAAVLAAAWANDPDPWVAAADWQWLRLVPFSMTGREALPGSGT